MIDKKLLSILVCPVDHAPLGIANDQLIARLNRDYFKANLFSRLLPASAVAPVRDGRES